MSPTLPHIDQIVIILLFGVVGAKLADLFDLPIIIPLLFSGFLLGPEGLGLFDPTSLGLSLATLATLLIPLILFNEGLHIGISSLNRFRRPVFLLATVGVVVTMLGVGVIAYYVLGMSLISSLLLGAILAATDPGAVHAIAKSLGIEEKISTIVEGESAFNDASSIVLTTVLLGAALGEGLQVGAALMEFVWLFFGGIILGGFFAMVAATLIKTFEVQVYAVSFSLAIFLVVFSTAEALGFSGITAVVAAAIIFGNELRSEGFRITERNRVYEFWRHILFLAQSIIFLVLGAGISYSVFAAGWLEALIIVVALFFVARPAAVFVSTLRYGDLSRRERWFVSWVGAKGAISAALASLVVGAGIPGAMRIFNIVLVAVVVSLLIVSFTAGRMALRTLDMEKSPPIMDEYFKVLSEYTTIRDGILEFDQRFQDREMDVETLRDMREEFKQTMMDLEEIIKFFEENQEDQQNHLE